MLFGIGIALFLGTSLVLYCCVRVGAKADKEIEKILQKKE